MLLGGARRRVARFREGKRLQALTVERPATIQQAVQLLHDGGDTARVLAGGTDVIVIARSRRRTIDLLVDVKRIPELTAIEWDPGSGLTIGAATPCYSIYDDADIQANYPAIIDSASRNASCAASRSPASIAVTTFLM